MFFRDVSRNVESALSGPKRSTSNGLQQPQSTTLDSALKPSTDDGWKGEDGMAPVRDFSSMGTSSGSSMMRDRKNGKLPPPSSSFSEFTFSDKEGGALPQAFSQPSLSLHTTEPSRFSSSGMEADALRGRGETFPHSSSATLRTMPPPHPSSLSSSHPSRPPMREPPAHGPFEEHASTSSTTPSATTSFGLSMGLERRSLTTNAVGSGPSTGVVQLGPGHTRTREVRRLMPSGVTATSLHHLSSGTTSTANRPSMMTTTASTGGPGRPSSVPLSSSSVKEGGRGVEREIRVPRTNRMDLQEEEEGEGRAMMMMAAGPPSVAVSQPPPLPPPVPHTSTLNDGSMETRGKERRSIRSFLVKEPVKETPSSSSTLKLERSMGSRMRISGGSGERTLLEKKIGRLTVGDDRRGQENPPSHSIPTRMPEGSRSTASPSLDPSRRRWDASRPSLPSSTASGLMAVAGSPSASSPVLRSTGGGGAPPSRVAPHRALPTGYSDSPSPGSWKRSETRGSERGACFSSIGRPPTGLSREPTSDCRDRRSDEMGMKSRRSLSSPFPSSAVDQTSTAGISSSMTTRLSVTTRSSSAQGMREGSYGEPMLKHFQDEVVETIRSLNVKDRACLERYLHLIPYCPFLTDSVMRTLREREQKVVKTMEEGVYGANTASTVHNLIVVDKLYRYFPRRDYLLHQKDITPGMRVIVVDWIIGMHDFYKHRRETLHLSVNIYDRYLSVISHGGKPMDLPRSKLQLLAVTAYLVAVKMEEIYMVEMKSLLLMTGNAYTKEEVLETEVKICTTLSFRFTIPMSYQFSTRLLVVLESSPLIQECKDRHKQMGQLFHLTNYFLELALLDYSLLKYLPSQVGNAAVFLAIYTLQCNALKRDATLRHLRGNTEEERRVMRERSSSTTSSTYSSDSISTSVESLQFSATARSGYSSQMRGSRRNRGTRDDNEGLPRITHMLHKNGRTSEPTGGSVTRGHSAIRRRADDPSRRENEEESPFFVFLPGCMPTHLGDPFSSSFHWHESSVWTIGLQQVSTEETNSFYLCAKSLLKLVNHHPDCGYRSIKHKYFGNRDKGLMSFQMPSRLPHCDTFPS